MMILSEKVKQNHEQKLVKDLDITMWHLQLPTNSVADFQLIQCSLQQSCMLQEDSKV